MITLVASFPRAGSSMTMKMLHAGGMEVYAENLHSFEHADILRLPSDALWLSKAEGRAMKLLDPHRYTPPPGDYRAIWLDRDPIEQARSQAKFLGFLHGVKVSQRQIEAVALSLVRDRTRAVGIVQSLTKNRLITLTFGEILSDPVVAAKRVAGLLPGLDVQRMAAVVRDRSPFCAATIEELDELEVE